MGTSLVLVPESTAIQRKIHGYPEGRTTTTGRAELAALQVFMGSSAMRPASLHTREVPGSNPGAPIDGKARSARFFWWGQRSAGSAIVRQNGNYCPPLPNEGAELPG
jgi:hypothetical protein